MSQGEPQPSALGCLVITVGGEREAPMEAACRAAAERLVAHGLRVEQIRHLPAAIESLRDAIDEGVRDPRVAVLLVIGGTGPGEHDVTPEALEPMLSRALPGFGELFRQLSYRGAGAAAVLSRVSAGVIHRNLVFTLPAQASDCRMAIDELIAPALPAAMALLRGEPAG